MNFFNLINSKQEAPCNTTKLRSFIFLLLLIGGNVQPNPDPAEITTCNTKEAVSVPLLILNQGLDFIHLNVWSLIAKLDMILIWACTTNADVIAIFEWWLSKSFMDKVINGYNAYRTDRSNRGSGITIFIKSLKKFHVNVLFSFWLSG